MIDSEKAAANRKAREEKKKAYLRGMFDRYTARFHTVESQDALSVAREAHAAIDAVLERDRKKEAIDDVIKCRRGCSNCCHGPVEIWPHEAALLVEGARKAGVEIDKVRLERQERYSIDTWWQQPAADQACVFLGADGACGVYEFRPNACRKLLVMSDPALCDGSKHPPERIERWFSWEAEMLESAAQEVFGGGLMPRSLLAELNKREA